MEKRMKLSVLVPVYNTAGEGKLEYCLNSLVNQTCRDMEIIAVDDCSTDNSWEILRRYEAEYPDRFRAVHSPVNRKQGGAKNIGLSMAGGEWIGFIDSDDWITPDMYEVMLARAEETGADMVGCDYCLTHEHSMKVGQVVPNNKPSQAGVLDHEKYASLILEAWSLKSTGVRLSLAVTAVSRKTFFMRIMRWGIHGCCVQRTLPIFPKPCTIITSMRNPRCIPSPGNDVRTGWKPDGS